MSSTLSFNGCHAVASLSYLSSDAIIGTSFLAWPAWRYRFFVDGVHGGSSVGLDEMRSAILEGAKGAGGRRREGRGHFFPAASRTRSGLTDGFSAAPPRGPRKKRHHRLRAPRRHQSETETADAKRKKKRARSESGCSSCSTRLATVMSFLGQLLFFGGGAGIIGAFITAGSMSLQVLSDAETATKKMVAPSFPPSPPLYPPPLPPPPEPPLSNAPVGVARRSLKELSQASTAADSFALRASEKGYLAETAARLE